MLVKCVASWGFMIHRNCENHTSTSISSNAGCWSASGAAFRTNRTRRRVFLCETCEVVLPCLIESLMLLCSQTLNKNYKLFVSSVSFLLFLFAVCLLVLCACSGFVRAQQQVYLIEPLGQSEDGDHAVYRQEDLKVSGRPGCGSSSNTSTPYDRDRGPALAGLFRSRSWVGDMGLVWWTWWKFRCLKMSLNINNASRHEALSNGNWGAGVWWSSHRC